MAGLMSGQTVLMFDKNGKVTTIQRFRGMMITLFMLLIIITLFSVCLYLLYHGKRIEVNEAYSELKVAREKISSLLTEKDKLMARLIVLKTAVGGSEENKAEAVEKDSENEQLTEQARGGSTEEEKSAERENAAAKGAEYVAVENFKVTCRPESKVVKASYKIKNIAESNDQITGYTFVVLEKEHNKTEHQFTLPPLQLSGPEPGRVEKGQYFSIFKFKNINLERQSDEELDVFERASVYIYTQSGKLILKNDFEIQNT